MAPAWAGPADDEQTITFQLIAPPDAGLDGAWVDFPRMGVPRSVPLTDDGSAPGDIAGDGVWTGSDTGPFVRLIDARVRTARGGRAPTLAAAEPVDTDAAWAVTVAWRVVATPDRVTAARTPVAHPGRPWLASDGAHLAGAFGWLIFIAVFVMGVLFLMGRDPDR